MITGFRDDGSPIDSVWSGGEWGHATGFRDVRPLDVIAEDEDGASGNAQQPEPATFVADDEEFQCIDCGRRNTFHPRFCSTCYVVNKT